MTPRPARQGGLGPTRTAAQGARNVRDMVAALGCTPEIDGNTAASPLAELYANGQLRLAGLFRDRAGRLDQAFNEVMATELGALSADFGVEPAFLIDQSPDILDAITLQASLAPGLPATTIIVSRGLYLQYREAEQRVSSYTGFAFLAICAHEFSHVYQLNAGYRQLLIERFPTRVGLELHADLLAGWAFARNAAVKRVLGPGNSAGEGETEELRAKEMVQVVVDSWSLGGDQAFTSINHHGTPDQRVSALLSGMRAARRGVPLQTLARSGVELVTTLAGRA